MPDLPVEEMAATQSVNDNEVDPAGRTPVVAEGGSAVAEEASLVAEGPPSSPPKEPPSLPPHP
jgi:hypothetical protein